MADIIREQVLGHPLRRFRYVQDAGRGRGAAGHRWTRVPFLKVMMSGTLGLAGEGGRLRAVLQPGDAVLFAPGSFVNVAFRRSCRYFRVTLDEDRILAGVEVVRLPLREREGWPAGRMEAAVLPEVLAPAASRLLEGLCARKGGGGPQDAREIDSCRVLLWELADQFSQAAEAPRPVPTPPAKEWTWILRCLQDRFHQPVSRTSVARALGMSAGHLGRVLRAGTGKTFGEIVSELRLEQARWLLVRSRLTVEEVAFRSGYRSANYFAQAFRRAEGMGPREWRRRQAPGEGP